MLSKRDRDRLVQVAARVQELRIQLASAEAELDGLLRNDAQNGATPVSQGSIGTLGATGVRGPETLKDRVFGALSDSRGYEMTPTGVAQALGLGPEHYQSVRSTLSRLASEGPVVAVKRGLYCVPIAPGEEEGSSGK